MQNNIDKIQFLSYYDSGETKREREKFSSARMENIWFKKTKLIPRLQEKLAAVQKVLNSEAQTISPERKAHIEGIIKSLTRTINITQEWIDSCKAKQSGR